jgi:nitrogen regulatory protein P-II 1
MKRIEAIIRDTKIEDVKEALQSINISSFTYTDCLGAEKLKMQGVYRGNLFQSDVTRYLVNIVVPDENLKVTVDCILNAANTGKSGDGEIFVSTIDESWKIRTKESNTSFC